MAPTAAQWRLVQAIPLIPVGLAFITSFYLTDTPRWLASKGRGEEALAVLTRLRCLGGSGITEEYREIQEEIQTKQQILAEVSTWTTIKEVFMNPNYRKRFLLGGKLLCHFTIKICSGN
jgi:hypothetical protein